MGNSTLYKETLYQVDEKVAEARRLITETLLDETLSSQERENLTATAMELCNISHDIIDRRTI